MSRVLLFICLQILTISGLSGQCTIAAKREVCVNDLVSFNLTISSGTATAYDWDFGAYGTSSNTSPLMKFTSAGKLLVRCTVTLVGGQKCTDTHSIEILPLPTAKFGIAKTSLFCLHENKICLDDSSIKAAKGIAKINLVWGDGNLSQFTPPLSKQWCHNYSDTGLHTATLEIEDSAGCKDNFSGNVHIRPSIEHLLIPTINPFCDSVQVCLDNAVSGGKSISNEWYIMPGNQSASIQTPWCKMLQPKEKLDLKLVSTNEYGCKDSIAFAHKVPPGTFYLKKVRHKICAIELTSGMATVFKSGEEVQWYLNGVLYGIDSLFIASNDAVLGMNYVRAVRIGGCKGTLTDSFEVLGIGASAQIFNDNRRRPQDTVFFRDITPKKAGTQTTRLWDFGDKFAEKCTTSTALGMNVGRNCNFSMDSIARHYYTDTFCYTAKLSVFDSVTGCWDDTALGVYRKEMCPDFFVPPTICADLIANFVMPPNMAKKVGEKNFLITNVNGNIDRDSIVMYKGFAAYRYSTPGLKSPVLWRYYDVDTVWTVEDGKMVVKFIRPAEGWVADTFFNAVNVVPQSNADFDMVVISSCNPFTVRLNFYDTMWYYPDTIFAYWGDTTTLITNFTDTVHKLKYIEHTYPTGGAYKIVIRLKPSKGCEGVDDAEVRFSHLTYFKSQVKCPGESVCFRDSVLQLGVPSPANRWLPSGLYGQLYWDFGDGTKDTGYNMCHIFPGTGDFVVTLNARNISGCNVVAKDTIRLTAPRAGMRVPALIYCSEIKQYFDSSYVLLPNNGQVINQWSWNFGDGSTPASAKNPVHVFPGGGDYQVKLRIRTNLGCRDSVTKTVHVVGPEVSARIVSDSVGCAPLKVEFTNLSKQSKNFIWQFGDQKNTVYSTDRDTNTRFTYTKGGVYYAHITGGDSFYNPTTGSKYYCSVKYPAPGSEEMKIVVYESSMASFNAPEILCVHDTVTFENTSTGGASKYFWDFGNGDTALRGMDTFQYKFQQTGTYKVRLYGRLSGANPLCLDTAEKEIKVIILSPDFKQECNNTGTELILRNLSDLQIDGYQWTFFDPQDSSEILLSEEYDLIHNFGSETGVKWVCLGLNNGKACGGKVCKQVFLQGAIFLANVFTPGKDGFNDTYKVPLQGYEKFNLKIFNRWGERIYESSDPATEWNGKVFNSGPELPSGTYFYRLSYQTSCDGKPKEVTGSITLIR